MTLFHSLTLLKCQDPFLVHKTYLCHLYHIWKLSKYPYKGLICQFKDLVKSLEPKKIQQYLKAQFFLPQSMSHDPSLICKILIWNPYPTIVLKTPQRGNMLQFSSVGHRNNLIRYIQSLRPKNFPPLTMALNIEKAHLWINTISPLTMFYIEDPLSLHKSYS